MRAAHPTTSLSSPPGLNQSRPPPTALAQGLEPLHPDSLEMAEMLVRAGYRPAVYRGMLVRRAGEQQARLVQAFDPAAEDAGLRVAGSGR